MTPTFFLNNIFPIVLIVLVSLIVNRIATIALTLTGMSRASARFQARSALSGTGFTTSEAEGVVSHPVRRRIVMILMMTGNAGIVVTIGSLAATTSRSVVNRGEGGLPLWATYALIVLAIGSLLYVMGLGPVDRALSRVIRRGLRRYTDLEVRDYEALLEIHGGYTVSELLVRPHDWVADKTLADLRPNDEGVLVLGVQRHGDYLGAPTGAMHILPGDRMLVYGPQARVKELDERPAGPDGDARRDEAVRQMRGKTPSAGSTPSGRATPATDRPAREALEEGL